MEILIMIIGAIILIVDSTKGASEKEKEQKYDSLTGLPIYNSKYIVKEYDENTGRPIYEHEYKIIEIDEKGEPVYDKKAKVIGYEVTTGYPLFEGEEAKLIKPQHIETQKENRTKTRLSNTILMIVGAILVVIASIVFLVSSWDSMHGLLKTLILIAIQMIFMLFSRICNKNLDIPKVSKVFNYLVIAFVPIILLSLSCFEALGEYLSITGDGWPYYFGVVFLITDVFYKYYAKTKDDLVLRRMSFAAEILSLIFFCGKTFEIFSYSIIVFIIHSIIMYILLHGNYLDKKSYGILNDIYTYILIAITALAVFSEESIVYNIGMLLYTIFYLIKYIKNIDSKNSLINILLFLFCYSSTLRIVNLLEIPTYFIYIIALIPIALLTNTMKSKSVSNATRKIIMFASIGIVLLSLTQIDKTIYYLLTFASVFALYLIMYLMTEKATYKALSYISILAIFLDICYILDLNELAKYVPLIVATLIYLFEYVFDELKDETSPYVIIGMLYLSSIILVENITVILPFILLVAYIKLEDKNENLLILPMIMNISLMEYENEEIGIAISFILLVIYSVLSFMKRKLNIFSIFSLITLICITSYYEITGLTFWLILLIWSVAHLLVNVKEVNYFYKTITVIGSLGLYITILYDYIVVEYVSLYLLGFYIALIALTKYVYKDIDSISALEIIGSVITALAGVMLIDEVGDGIVMIIIPLVLAIYSFSKKWKVYFYCTLITMIFYIVVLALRFWGLIPWYIYILFIGFALIVYAIYDEKKKNKKEEKTVDKTEENK